MPVGSFSRTRTFTVQGSPFADVPPMGIYSFVAGLSGDVTERGVRARVEVANAERAVVSCSQSHEQPVLALATRWAAAYRLAVRCDDCGEAVDHTAAPLYPELPDAVSMVEDKEVSRHRRNGTRTLRRLMDARSYRWNRHGYWEIDAGTSIARVGFVSRIQDRFWLPPAAVWSLGCNVVVANTGAQRDDYELGSLDGQVWWTRGEDSAPASLNVPRGTGCATGASPTMRGSWTWT